MIPRAHVLAWRAVAPWPSDSPVEQDLIISRAMVEIFASQPLRSLVALRGGTALHKIYLPRTRYSEDIDLVQVRPGPIGDTVDAVRQQLDGWLGRPKRVTHEDMFILRYRAESEFEPGVSLRLKVEINTREHFTTLGLVSRAFHVVNPWFEGQAEITTFTLNELLATKLRALYQRKKGRDLYDLWYALANAGAAPDVIVESFLRYMKEGETPVSRAEFEENLQDKLTRPDFEADVRALLIATAHYDQAIAGELVHR